MQLKFLVVVVCLYKHSKKFILLLINSSILKMSVFLFCFQINPIQKKIILIKEGFFSH